MSAQAEQERCERFAVVPVADRTGYWRIIDVPGGGRPVRPHGWGGWESDSLEAAQRECRDLNAGGPLRPLVEAVLTGCLDAPPMRWARDKVVHALGELPEIEPPGSPRFAAQVLLLYRAFMLTRVAAPPLTDESAPPVLEVTPVFALRLRQGIEWLDMPQPQGAAVHSGIGAWGEWTWNLRVRPQVLPVSATQNPTIWGGPVVAFEVRHSGHPLTEQETAELREAVAGIAPVTGQWNGAGTSGVSLQIDRPPHPSLLAAVELYRAKRGQCAKGGALLRVPPGWR